jgi:hypothetical protein
MKRIARSLLGPVLLLLFALLFLADSLTVASAATPTPAPTPSPLPPGYNGNSNFSSMVDNSAPLPWPLPNLPTFPAGSATPTLYAATPAHATDYPAVVGTATAQIGGFTAPINGITTPIAALVTSGPQAGEDDIIVTGADGDPVSVGDFLSDAGDGLGSAFAAIRAVPADLAAISASFLVLVFLLTVMLVAPIMRSGIELLSQLVKVVLGLIRAVREIMNTLALLFK